LALVLLGCSLDTRQVTRADSESLTPQGPGGPGSPETGGASGTSPGAAVLGVEPTALNFGRAVVGSPSRGRVSILNTGNAPLDAPIAVLQPGSDADYVILHDQCENTVAPAGRCDVRVQLMPSKTGNSTAALGVQSSGQSADVELAGSGLAAGPLTVSPSAGSSTDFGGVELDANGEAAFDVSNPTANSSGPLALSVNEGQFQLLPPVAGDCQPGMTALLDGQSCRVRVGFAPTRRGGADATLLVTSALGGTTLPLEGTGLLPPSLRAPGSVEFGGVVLGSVGLRTLSIENEGDVPLQLGGIALAGAASGEAVPSETAPVDASAEVPTEPGQANLPGAFSVRNSDCGAGKVLAGGERCNVTVAFRPLTADANLQTALLVNTADGVAASVALSGNGVSQGALVIAAASGASADFGELAVGQSASQKFVVSNPSAQPSGPLEIQTNDDFAVVPPSADGDCQTAVTSLVNGQSCAIAVSFKPSERGERDGGLLVSSVLAGAAHLPLAGRGLALPQLDIARSELDFGRVPTDTPVQQSVTVLNRGDQPLSAVHAVLEAPGGGPAKGFRLLDSCSGALEADASCELGLEFLPHEATTYAAVLRVVGDGSGAASTLLLGRAFPRGSLVVAAAAGSTDFGDVVLGSTRALDFTLTNPGSVPSGRLTLSTSSNVFGLAEGDCNPEGGSGLVNGSSCTFSVTFTPISSEAISANLSVQSPGAGETALSLTGRGRTAPILTATNVRDFGSANVNEDAVTNPQNQFTWTLTNGGDLASGPLQVANGDAAEFIVSNDSCSNVSVEGHGTCAMDIRFRPNASGGRTANLDVTDAVSSQALRLAMAGNGILIAAPGESCLNATCASGLCTAGVCCDRACNGSCQVCSGNGVCADQAGREACGNGSGQCFGVDKCLLPELQACSGDDQCGAGNCEQRLGGQGPNDKICCLEDCGTNGQQCNAQGRCAVPTLGSGAACGAAGQLACGAGLVCKSCLAGGSQCTPPDLCCGGCGTGYTCLAGECGCPVGSNGQPQIDCGGGQCILDRQDACCASSPSCPANAPVCDGPAGLCRQCLQAADCPAGATGTFRSCTNSTCVYACSTQQGFKDCNGTCISSTACCDCNGPCNTCNGGTCSLLASGQPGQCTGGQVCGQNGQCVAPNPAALVTVTGGAPAAFDRTLVNNVSGTPRTWSVQNTGASPTGALTLTNTDALEFQVTGTCIGLVLQPGASCSVSITFAPRSPGNRTATLTLNGGQNVSVNTSVQGLAKIPDGSPCSATIADCDSNRCTEWLIDADGDGFGAPQAIGGFPSARVCGDASAANQPPPLLMPGKGCQGVDLSLPYVAPQAFDDCCDGLICDRGPLAAGNFNSRSAFPGQTQAQAGTAICNGNSTNTSDFDCVGGAVLVDVVHSACGAAPAPTTAADCAARSGFQSGPLVCGTSTTPVNCSFATGVCVAVGPAPAPRPPLCL
jgi:hypothetical protein